MERRIGPGLLGRLAATVLTCGLLLGIPGIVAAQDTASQRDTTQSNAQADTTAADSTQQWGYPVDSTADDQNPPGYRGMERPSSLPDSGEADTTAPADATSRVNQMERQDTTSGQNQNPPGYRGMERPVGDSAATQQGDTASMRGDTAAADTAGADTLGEDGTRPDSGQ
jgi:hypothetical protein